MLLESLLLKNSELQETSTTWSTIRAFLCCVRTLAQSFAVRLDMLGCKFRLMGRGLTTS